MRRILLLAAFVALIVSVASADLDSIWVKYYGGSASDGFRRAIPTSDGGFIAVGYTYSFGAGDVDVFVVKTDEHGDSLWMRAYGGASLDYGNGVCETSDGAYIVAGFTMSFGAGNEDIYLVKLDAAGDTLWTRTYGGSGSEEAKSVCFTSDGYIVVAGLTDSFGSGQNDVYVLKVDTDGDSVWTRAFGGGEADWAEEVCETADGCYGVSGSTGSFNTTRDAYMLKVDPLGNLVWQDSYGSSIAYREDYGAGACALADSGMASTGFRTDQDRGDPCQIGFLRINGAGVQGSYRKYQWPSVEYGCSVCETADDGFLICGAVKDADTHRNDLFLLKRIQGSGWVWNQAIGETGSDWGNSVAEVMPGYYIVAGYTESWGSGGFDGWLLHMKEAEAEVPPAVGINGGAVRMAAYPNPFSQVTSFRFSLPRSVEVVLVVYDVVGRRVAVIADGVRQAGDHTEAWYGTDETGAEVSPGIYVARLAAGESVTSRKVVLLK
jgi:hypothetical protein